MSHLAESSALKIINEICSVQVSGFVRIPVGALCFQDFQVFRWPPERLAIDPDLLFEISVKGKDCTFVAPKFGQMGGYGNGSILMKLSEWKRANGILGPLAA